MNDSVLTVRQVAELLNVQVTTVHKWTSLARSHASGARRIRDPFPAPQQYVVDRPVYGKDDVVGWARRTGRKVRA